ncbi:MAG: hypothetical protein ACOVNU_13405 [Candidatus Kapaibacteriota bacterium]
MLPNQKNIFLKLSFANKFDNLPIKWVSLNSKKVMFDFQMNLNRLLKYIKNFNNTFFVNQNINKKFGLFYTFLSYIVIFFGISSSLNSQIYQANPSNWIFPDGNSEATKYNAFKSNFQSIDSFTVKWQTKAIAGDVQPLIGNIINNPRLNSNFIFAPNELAVVVGNEVKIVDARGGVFTQKSPNEFQFIKGISVLLDTLQTSISNDIRNPLVLGLETIEHKRDDSLAVTYMLGFDNNLKTTKILKRFAINMREYPDNIYASLKPVYGKLSGNQYLMYSTLNIANPKSTSTTPIVPEFMRGITQFESDNSLLAYPLADVPDQFTNRITLGPEVNLTQPSISSMIDGELGVLLPTYPSPSLVDVNVTNPTVNSTITNKPYLLGFDINSNIIDEKLEPRDLTDFINGTRPQIRSYFIDLQNSDLPVEPFVLIAEEYKGIEGSVGTSRLHLFDKDGVPLTFPNDALNPPFVGSQNHLWSVAVGNVDGNLTNEILPFYPNNRGKEIIVTQTSKDFVHPSSKIFVFRYNSDDVPKPPPYNKLFPFDTIVSHRINGWVAAVNDLDGAPDNKDEIVLVDGGKLVVIRMRDYQNVEFRLGRRFDTVYVKDFGTETITSVAVSDIEGDSFNDIIVTTFSSTYIVGIPLQNLIQLQEPKSLNSANNYCVGDSVSIEWSNLLLALGNINIKFQTVRDSIYFDLNTNLNRDTLLLDSLITLKTDIINDLDLMKFKLFVDTTLMGKKGYIIIESKNSPGTIFDTSKVITFNNLALTKTNFLQSKYRVGEEIIFNGQINCIDSIKVEYLNEAKEWTELITQEVKSTLPIYEIKTNIPCLNVFNCNGLDNDSLIYFRLISKVGEINYFNSIDSLGLLPANFPLVLDTIASACPTVEIKWSSVNLTFPCDSLSLSYSLDSGKTFNYIGEVESSSEKYVWQVPTSLPDSVLLRVCCNNSCIRTDTIITGVKVNYIDIVAPNPFNPYQNELEIIYKVIKDEIVTMKIYDANNRLVKEILSGQTRIPGIAYCEKWNGYNEDGILSNVGTYYIVLELSDSYREIYPVFLRK